MKVKIHRGSKEIGGSCIEVEAAGSRILLDLGLPWTGTPMMFQFIQTSQGSTARAILLVFFCLTDISTTGVLPI
jgi:predicted metal-dependent RNase